MLRTLKNLFICTAASAILLTACNPEQVSPRKHGDDRPHIGLAGEGGHPVMNPVCSDSFTMRLKSPNNSFSVNYQCTANCPDWGSVTMVNGEDSLAVYCSLAMGWYLDINQSAFTLASNFAFDANGRPVVSNDFLSTDVNELNKWSLFISKDSIEKDGNACFAAALKLTVVKLSFFGGVDPASRRELWAVNESYNDPGSPHASSSEFLLNWCWKSCAPPTPGGPYPADSCVAIADIPAYACSSAGGGGGNGCGGGYGGYGGYGGGNSISSNTTRCVTNSGNAGTFNFSGPGKLVIESGANVTAAISASNGGTIIVKGTFNWVNNASYNGNMNIFVAEGGTLNRSGNLSLNGTNSDVVNHGTLAITQNLTIRGSLANSGTLTARALSLAGDEANFINTGSAAFTQSISANCQSGGYGGGYGGGCGGQQSCDAFIQNCGRIDAGTSITIGQGVSLRNYCTLVARGFIQMNGDFDNYAIAVAGTVGAGNGYINNGDTRLHSGSVILSRQFNWGSGRTISVDGQAWIIAAECSIGANGHVESLGSTGRLIVNSNANLTGGGNLELVDSDPYQAGDLPTGANAQVLGNINKLDGSNATARPAFLATDVPIACEGNGPSI